MRLAALAAVLAATTVCASAGAPAPRRPPPPPPAVKACSTAGAPLFEIDHDAEAGAKLPTSKTTLYASGAWVTEGKDAAGKALAPSRGCLAPDVIAKLKAELEAAPWKIEHHRFHCMAYSASFTVYSFHGKQVFTARLCSPDSIDDQSKKAIDAVELRLAGK
jgi:hypothetical protein